MHFMTFSKSEIILVTKFMGSACLRGLHILFLGVFPRPISSDNSVDRIELCHVVVKGGKASLSQSL